MIIPNGVFFQLRVRGSRLFFRNCAELRLSIV